jgi:hypothetical protein
LIEAPGFTNEWKVQVVRTLKGMWSSSAGGNTQTSAVFVMNFKLHYVVTGD